MTNNKKEIYKKDLKVKIVLEHYSFFSSHDLTNMKIYKEWLYIGMLNWRHMSIKKRGGFSYRIEVF